MKPLFSYEKISPDADGRTHFRIRDANDDRIATCYVEDNAREIVIRLNKLEGIESEARQHDLLFNPPSLKLVE